MGVVDRVAVPAYVAVLVDELVVLAENRYALVDDSSLDVVHVVAYHPEVLDTEMGNANY